MHQVPAINFPVVRLSDNRLADRAECFLLLGQPEEALGELTLLNDLSDCLEGKLCSKPMTLARVSGSLAARAVFVEKIAQGLRWRVWREPELLALQSQLSHVDLMTLVGNAMESERAGEIHLLETAPRSEAAAVLGLSDKPGFWLRISHRKSLVFSFMPQGWVWQNLALVANLDQYELDNLNRNQGCVYPRLVEVEWAKTLTAVHRSSPYAFLAKNATTQAKAPLMAAARTQALINEALVACAMERCYLAQGGYPETLDGLVPMFLPVLPVDPVNGVPLKYQPGARGHFLLYSIGWNERDDGGVPGDGAGNGDWVWGVPFASY